MGGIKSNQMSDFIISVLKNNDSGNKLEYREKQIKVSNKRSE